MTFSPRKIFVCCPADAVTGGPELLHQLVDALRAAGHDAHISYYPFDRPAACPAPYKHYDTMQADILDEPDSLVIVPELGIHLLKRLRRAQGAIWWLSVDNYAGGEGTSFLRDWTTLLKRLVKGRWQPRFTLKRHIHFVQSHYAREFLRAAGIGSSPLSDYLGETHLDDKARNPSPRRNLIAYNPRKGMVITRRLIANNPGLQFCPIENMTANEVSQLLTTAKVYIDFGNHPGKDRMPREAAMSGCCVVTGRRGSAKHHQDVAISDSYKLDDASHDFQSNFAALIDDIFSDFAVHQLRFQTYRNVIRQEPARFQNEVATIFGICRARQSPPELNTGAEAENEKLSKKVNPKQRLVSA